jgi:glycosyltransferase involved in cell wall biosynthesis
MGTGPRSRAQCQGALQVKQSPSSLISVVIPFCNAAAYLEGCLEALRRSDFGDFELILVNDGSTDSSPEIARRFSDRILTFASPHGPAFARNRGVEAAQGEILFFIDADVLCYPDTLSKISAALAADPGLAAMIGSYDNAPLAADFLSRYKNLTHHFVHQTARAEASTFWTGCGAVRRDAFSAAGGFDESYRLPSIEDIELGYRLRSQGRRIALCEHLVVKHAKRWTLRSLLKSDIVGRAIPWTILQLTYGEIIDDLNVSRSQRAASICMCLALLGGVLGFWNMWFLAPAAALLIPVIGWNWRLYRLYVKSGGLWFCLGAVLMHWLYYVYSALAFALGCLIYLIRRPKRKKFPALR